MPCTRHIARIPVPQTDPPCPFINFLGYPSLNCSGGNFTAMPQPFDNLPKDSGSYTFPSSIDTLITTACAACTPKTINYLGLLCTSTSSDSPTPAPATTSQYTKKVHFTEIPVTPSTDPTCICPIKNSPPNPSPSPGDRGAMSLSKPVPVKEQKIVLCNLCQMYGGYNHRHYR
jgi:hypothetical protein